MKKRKNEEMKIKYFDSVPNDLEIIIISFIICEMTKNWKRDWNNISLVSKHWNSISWISFQRTIPKSEKETIFIQGCKEGFFHFISKILTQDITFDPSFEDNKAIRLASEKGFIEIVKLLLKDERVDPSAQNNYAIRRAIENGYIDIVKLLLQDNRVDPSDNDNAAIQSASYFGKFNVTKLLLKDKRVNPSNNAISVFFK